METHQKNNIGQQIPTQQMNHAQPRILPATMGVAESKKSEPSYGNIIPLTKIELPGYTA